MAQEMERMAGTSEEEDDEEMEMEVKEEEDNEEERIANASMADGTEGSIMRFQQNQMQQQGGVRRSRPKEEKERTKMRERHRRAITARILAGLRKHGNYNLRVRADINDVIAALAREAGWVVLPDGTTFPSKSPSSSSQQPQTPGPAAAPSTSALTLPSMVPVAQTPPASLRGGVSSGFQTSSAEYLPCRLKGVFTPPTTTHTTSYSSVQPRSVSMLGDGGERTENSHLVSSCIDTVDGKQVMDITPRMQERDFAGTPYVPVYVMLPLGVINMKCELVDPDGLLHQLRILKSINVDGVMVDCWWGIVEAHAPQEYNWSGYRRLFQIVRDLKLKLQVVMSFHQCGGNVGDDVCIPLPHWVAEIGRANPEIFFTDREGRRNPECLTWGIDKERVLRGRTAVEVYFDYMRSFRVEFDDFFEDRVISEVEIGLGPCGELRYPSYPIKHGWRYPGIGEFQCYDQYLMKSLRKAAEARGHSFWARGPDNAGTYNSRPHETGFFCDGGDYDSYYGRFFLGWYSQILVDHGARVLSLAKLAFEGTFIAVKISGIHWWYKTASHAAELASGFYNSCNRDGYAAIAAMLKKHGAALNFACVEMRTMNQQMGYPEALADPEGLVWQVLNSAWDVGIPVASENALPCHDRDGSFTLLTAAFAYAHLPSSPVGGVTLLFFWLAGEAVLDLQL
ncbi:beta-amylase 2, chloroplastic-like protein [Cinnamomum micranthum f. kanehirae]|uniref:Beta-amylase n=1 Tax=Cinnamomum micranthum f. kanehirae TaxID=337451 RepID=A0A443N0Y4_9MAGN|nr:beta-amylase 2, chloroplastic-like protein [Cinnamomum micranthum f. kanehirae]